MCITYSVLSCKLGTIFSTFSIFILSGKILVNHYDVHVILQDIEQQLQEKFRHHFLHCSYLSIYIKLRSIFYPLKIIYRKLLRYSQTISSIYIPLLKIRRSFFFYHNLSCILNQLLHIDKQSDIFLLLYLFLSLILLWFSNTSGNINIFL